MNKSARNVIAKTIEIRGIDDPNIEKHIPEHLLGKLREELEMARELLPKFNKEAFLQGTLTPIWFG